jgi:Right handed beta helix region
VARWLIVILALFAALLIGRATAAPAAVSCAAWASPTGDDLGPGTATAPFRTIARLLQAVRPGNVGCLTPAAVFNEHVVIGSQGAPKQPITITTPSGTRATIGEGVEFLQSSRFVVLSRVVVRVSANEPYSSLPAVVQIGGFSNVLSRSDVSAAAAVDKSRTCVLIDHGNVAVVDRNMIHECGVIKDNPAIYAAGILVATGGSPTITNNVIRSTPGDAIAFSPNAQQAVVTRNLIDGTSNGVFFAGDARFTPNRNRVFNNIISFVQGYAAHGSNAPGRPPSVGNVVTKNCVWQPGRGLFAGTGFTAPANRVVDPQFQGRPASFALKRSSPCWAYRPLP